MEISDKDSEVTAYDNWKEADKNHCMASELWGELKMNGKTIYLLVPR